MSSVQMLMPFARLPTWANRYPAIAAMIAKWPPRRLGLLPGHVVMRVERRSHLFAFYLQRRESNDRTHRWHMVFDADGRHIASNPSWRPLGNDGDVEVLDLAGGNDAC